MNLPTSGVVEPDRVHHFPAKFNFPSGVRSLTEPDGASRASEVTKRGKTEETQSSKTWMPPRGIRLLAMPACVRRPHAVQWRMEGKRRTKNFATQTAQLAFAKSLVADVKALGAPLAYRLDETESRDWRAFRTEIGTATLAQVLACWARHGKQTPKLKDAVAAFLDAKRAEGVAPTSLSHFKPVLDRLMAAVGDVDAGSVERDHLVAFLSELPQSNESKRTHYKRIRSLFRWLKDTRQIGDNPCDGWKGPREVVGPISVMPVEHGRLLFAKNESEPRALLGRMALEAFAGIRHGAAANLPAACIDFKTRTITIPAGLDKNRSDQFIEHTPANLWKWLKWSNPETWSLSGLAYRNAKSAAFVRAGVPHPHNVLRHSAPTYDLAAHGDAGKTAAMLTHANLRLMFKRYRGKSGGKKNGVAWQNIVPTTP